METKEEKEVAELDSGTLIIRIVSLLSVGFGATTFMHGDRPIDKMGFGMMCMCFGFILGVLVRDIQSHFKSKPQ